MTQDIVERLRSQFHLTQGDGLNALLATGDEAADLIEKLRAENEEQADRIAELEDVLKVPEDLAEHILHIGKAEWGATNAKSAEAHGADVIKSIHLTEEHFGQVGPQQMQGLYVDGLDVVICHTGTSPNSANTARVLTGTWNFFHALAAQQKEVG